MKYRFLYIIVYFFLVHSSSTIFAKKILVTGGAGFIGGHVVEQLLNRGDFVVVVDNLNDSYPIRFKKNNLLSIKKSDINKKFKFYEANICDVSTMRTIFDVESPDIICHLAARAGVRTSIENPYEYVTDNVLGSIAILELAREFGIKHVVCASSSTVYGTSENELFSEEDPVNCQISPYGATKRSVELLSYVYNYLYGISITNLRFFSVYGPRSRFDMAPFIFMDALYNGKKIIIYGDGKCVRDFTYIDDIVDGVIRSIDMPNRYQIINLGRGEPIVLSDFIKTMEHVVGTSGNITYGSHFSSDALRTSADIKKAKDVLGYQPKVSIDSGLSKMYEWYKDEYLQSPGLVNRSLLNNNDDPVVIYIPFDLE